VVRPRSLFYCGSIGTQKPVECMRRPILNNSSPGQAIYDPFLGSGTTVIAAETTKRVCAGMELDPLYVDVAVRRWQAFTGAEAMLGPDGSSFAEIATERLTDGALAFAASEITKPQPTGPAAPRKTFRDRSAIVPVAPIKRAG